MSTTPKVPLTIDATQAGFPAGTDVYMYVVGLVSAASNTFYRLNSAGMPTAMSAADNSNAAGTFPAGSLSPAAQAALAPNYPLAWADYSIPVSLTAPTVIDLANINTTNCPGLGTGTAAFSGRVYFSIGVPKLPFTVQNNGYTAPVFNAFPGQFTLFDWIEFSYDSEGNFNGNTTQVDQFGFELRLDGAPGGSLQGQLLASRTDILNAFGPSVSGPFGGGALQVAVPAGAESAYPAGTQLLRAVSPKTLVAPASYTGALSTYFDAAITAAYEEWSSRPIVTNDQGTGYYSGMVVDGVLTFKQGNHPTGEAFRAATGVETFQIVGAGPTAPRIPTWDVWQCANSLATGAPEQKNVQKMIAAALNRGVISCSLDDGTCHQNAASFYPSTSTYNVWAKLFHGFSANRLAYGFPYDDVCNQNPSISLSPATSVTITLGPFATASSAHPASGGQADGTPILQPA